MQNSTSVNVLPLDRKDQKFDDKNLNEKTFLKTRSYQRQRIN